MPQKSVPALQQSFGKSRFWFSYVQRSQQQKCGKIWQLQAILHNTTNLQDKLHSVTALLVDAIFKMQLSMINIYCEFPNNLNSGTNRDVAKAS